MAAFAARHGVSAPGGQEQYDQWAAYNAQMAAYYSQQGGQYGGGY